MLRVITDSSCDLPQDIVKSLEITVVPCRVHFGDEVYRDGVDIQPEEFYGRLAHGTVHPTTSQPAIADLVGAFERVGSDADEVLCLLLSSRLSAAVASAGLAKDEIGKGPRIAIVDSRQVSLGLGLMVREVALIAKGGGSLEEAMAFLEAEKGNFTSYVSVDTLDYLVRGGRASKIQGFFGSVLDIKPVIQVRDGETHPVDRVRTRVRALRKLGEVMQSAPEVHAMGVVHSVCPDDAVTLMELCAGSFPRADMVTAQFSAVLGVHLGPRAIGMGLWTKA